MVRTYKELNETYKIARSRTIYENGKFIDINKDDYDVIVELEKTLYARKCYRIIKNTPGLSVNELAVICDRGNPPFGFSAGYKTIDIFTD